MAVENVILNNFTSGELTPLLDGRQDVEWYRNGARRQVNMISLPHGPTMRRPGTRLIAPAKLGLRTHLIPFIKSAENTYMLEFGDHYMRAFRDGGQLVVAPTDAAISNGDFPTGITGWDNLSGAGSSISHDATNDRLNLTSNGTTFAYAEQDVATTALNQVHVLAVTVFGPSGNEVTVRVGSASQGQQLLEDRALGIGTHLVSFTPASSPFYVGFRHKIATTVQIDDVAILASGAAAAVPLELKTPYAADDVNMLRTTQSRDIVSLRHRSYHGYELKRFGHLDWSLQRTEYQNGPYLAENVTATTLTAAAATGFAITVTASSTEGINDGRGFLATDVDRLIRIKNGSDWGWGVIASVTSTTVVRVDIRAAVGTAATASWRLGLYSDTTGHAKCATYHDERFFEANVPDFVDRFDGGTIGGFGKALDFTPGTNDDNAIEKSIGTGTVNEIFWMVSSQVLLMGTRAGIVRAGSLTTEDTLTPSKTPTKLQPYKGAADIDPVLADEAILYVHRAGRKLIELSYSFEKNGFKAPDMTRRSEHITKGGILQLAWQEEPWGVVWCVRADGMLLGFTYLREEGVTAWHQHPIGGGTVEAIATIPGPDGDELWLVVLREIAGQPMRTIERLDPFFDDDTAIEDCFFVDGGVTYEGLPTDEIQGLLHLEGLEVGILADGKVMPPRVVSAGKIALDREASKVHVGVVSPWALQPIRIEAGTRAGTAQGRQQKYDKVFVRLYRSGAFKQGRDQARLDDVPFGPPPAMGSPTPLFTGDKPIDYDASTEENPPLLLYGDLPLPAVVIGIGVEVNTVES
jgi:hypothetical protein